eukprot:3638372-Rhodomonas_salina.2
MRRRWRRARTPAPTPPPPAPRRPSSATPGHGISDAQTRGQSHCACPPQQARRYHPLDAAAIPRRCDVWRVGVSPRCRRSGRCSWRLRASLRQAGTAARKRPRVTRTRARTRRRPCLCKHGRSTGVCMVHHDNSTAQLFPRVEGRGKG